MKQDISGVGGAGYQGPNMAKYFFLWEYIRKVQWQLNLIVQSNSWTEMKERLV